MGRGVYALKTVPGETPLLKIPRDYIISVGTVENSESAFVYVALATQGKRLFQACEKHVSCLLEDSTAT